MLCSLQASHAVASTFYYSYEPGGSIGKISTNGIATPFVSSPSDIANALTVDSSGNIYQANQETKTVIKVTPGGGVSDYVTSASFSNPSGLAFDTQGNLYVSDYAWVNQASLWKVTTNGTVSLFATFSGGGALTYNKVTGDLYAGNYIGGNVYKIDSDGTVTDVTKVQSPNALTTDANGNVFVTSQGYNDTTPYITKITPDGQTSIFWTAGAFEGKYLNAVTFAEDGILYATYGQDILQFSPEGTATTFASGLGAIGLTYAATVYEVTLTLKSSSNLTTWTPVLTNIVETQNPQEFYKNDISVRIKAP
mgnify:CR=1 FL=1